MGKFKRLCLIVFIIAAIIGVGMLAVQWFSFDALMPTYSFFATMPWFFVVEAILLIIVAIGVIYLLGKALFTPGIGRNLTIVRDQGSVSITREALASTVTHVVDAHPGLSVERVRIHILKPRNPRINVEVRVDPGSHSQLAHLGETLQQEITAALEAFSGAPVNHVKVVFSGNAEAITPAFTHEALEHLEQYTSTTNSGEKVAVVNIDSNSKPAKRVSQESEDAHKEGEEQ
ncbi:alkaline shock response membrane anchor protein AmaP [Eggerthellaceae bacterium 3-80]|nr:alkaline shock response membrane anchor protein AmaP [bacterium D16-34]